MNITVYQDVTPCDLLEIYQTFFYPTDEGCKFTKAQLAYFDDSKWRYITHIVTHSHT